MMLSLPLDDYLLWKSGSKFDSFAVLLKNVFIDHMNYHRFIENFLHKNIIL